MKMLRTAAISAVILGASALSAAAGSVLIVNGADVTSESGTTASITTQLSNLHVAAGNTVTVVDSVPGSFAGFDEIWDIRFSSVSAITAGEEAQYLSFLQGGGGMFVMGENSSFTPRNDSVLSLIAAAGGGTLNFLTPGSTQTVNAPFTGPNPVSSVTYLAPGGVDSAGTGSFITDDGTNGTGVAWAVGDLTNALSGALTTIFDVNFMQDDADAASQALTANLINFVTTEVSGQVPLPAGFGLLIAGAAALGAASRRRAA